MSIIIICAIELSRGENTLAEWGAPQRSVDGCVLARLAAIHVLFHPAGMFGNSPTLQRWVQARLLTSPRGDRIKSQRFSRPFGTRSETPPGPNAEALGYSQRSLRDKTVEPKRFSGIPSTGRRLPRSTNQLITCRRAHNRLAKGAMAQFHRFHAKPAVNLRIEASRRVLSFLCAGLHGHVTGSFPLCTTPLLQHFNTPIPQQPLPPPIH
jgi:hypothetical protein